MGGRDNFYPRSPCGERHIINRNCNFTQKFLSTLSLRRATETLVILSKKLDDFYPRSPCGERHCTSIGRPKRLYFYPRSPCGERPTYFDISSIDDLISIHALLAESDNVTNFSRKIKSNFYPRSPCGERQLYINRTAKTIIFLSTLSLRRATEDANNSSNANLHFYPRSPCGERLGLLKKPRTTTALFLSTLSLRRATTKWQVLDVQPKEISIHALLAESDEMVKQFDGVLDAISIHALLAESDPAPYGIKPKINYFYPRSPCGERLGIKTKYPQNISYFYPRSPCGERPSLHI